MRTGKPYFVAQVPKLLEARGLCVAIDGVQALIGFNLSMDRGEIVAVIGPGGSGKSVLLDCLSGLRRASSGLLQMHRRSLRDKTPVEIVRGGLIRCFRAPRLFWERTALDNVLVGLHHQLHSGLLSTLLRTPGFHRTHQRAVERAMELLATFDLADHATTLAADLDLQQRRRLELARALATDPAILMLDEPASGMDVNQQTALAELIDFIRRQFHVGICLADDNPDLALRTADQIIVLDHGHTLAGGPPSEIRQDPAAVAVFGREPEVL